MPPRDPEHHTQKKARLRALLRSSGGVVTLPTLHRRKLADAAAGLGLPQVVRSVRTRANQVGSDVTLTFVALEAAHLELPPRELMHRAALTETYLRCQELYSLRDRIRPDERWQLVTSQGRDRVSLPDAEILGPHINLHHRDCAVEFDAGYDFGTIKDKLKSFTDKQGYRRVLWATSIHDRVKRMFYQIEDLGLPNLHEFDIIWVDFWSEEDRYGYRPRCRKDNHLGFRSTRLLEAAAAR